MVSGSRVSPAHQERAGQGTKRSSLPWRRCAAHGNQGTLRDIGHDLGVDNEVLRLQQCNSLCDRLETRGEVLAGFRKERDLDAILVKLGAVANRIDLVSHLLPFGGMVASMGCLDR